MFACGARTKQSEGALKTAKARKNWKVNGKKNMANINNKMKVKIAGQTALREPN